MADWIRVEGDSMRPFILRGDSIQVALLEPGSPIELGEVLLYRHAPEQWIIHRVIGPNPQPGTAATLHLKGDGIFCLDEVPREKVWGRIVGIDHGSLGSSRSRMKVQTTGLDRCLASLSSWSLDAGDGLLRKTLHCFVYGLSWCRRKTMTLEMLQEPPKTGPGSKP